MQGWEVQPLGDLCEFQRGLTYGKSDEVDVSSNVVLRANNVNLATHTLDLSDLRYIDDSVSVPGAKKVRRGSLLICTASGSKSHMGKIAYVDEDYGYAFGGFMGQITPAPSVDGRYLFHALTSPAYKVFIEALSDGVNINNLKFDDLREFTVPVPPLAEQRRIVAILDEAFEAIATAKANTEKNLQNAGDIFDSSVSAFFVPGAACGPLRPLGEVCKLENGDRGPNYPNRSEYVESGVPWINTGHIELDGTLSMNEMNFITHQKFRSLRSGKIQVGDLVYCLRGATLGKTALVDPLTEGAVASSLVIIRPSRLVDGQFLYFYLTSTVGQALIKGFENGAAQPNLGAKSVAQYPLPVPSIDEQRSIAKACVDFRDQTLELAAIYRRKLAALDELKNSLLHQAFTRALTSQSTDKQLEAVA